MEAARKLWAAVDRPNLFIKIPATTEGLPAITEVLGSGISVNVTLIFGLARYDQVMDAFLSGLEQARPLALDLAELAACVLPDWRGRRLGLDDCLKYCGLPVSDRHDALGDALVSAQLMQLLIGRAQQKGILTIGQARRLMQSHKQRQAHAF